VIANSMGFAVVDINMRGTGCSAGAFDFFEPLQSLDGYDIVETVARQPWVQHGKVGMLGISYGGISQLFTAQLQPPSLAAITPVSVIDATPTTLYPGGVLNTGFAVNWAKERMFEAQPSGPESGQEWAWKRIEEGDEECKENQALHGQAANLQAKIKANRHYRPKIVDPLSPVTFVDKINVPVFMACQWQDEQTGGHCPTLARRMTGTDKKWFTYTNGTHIDSLGPETFNRWYDFMKLYVAKQAPASHSAQIQAAAPLIYQAAMGIDGVTLPPDPIQQMPTYDAALGAFEAQPSIRVLFENGAGGDPGLPYPGFEHSFESFPVEDTQARSFYFASGGTLADAPPASGGSNAFTWNAKARPLTNFTGSTSTGENGLWTAVPEYDWRQPPKGSALSYISEPLAENTVGLGQGAVHAWIRSSKPKIDLQVTITEVRPDGKETFVQGGWLRAEGRKLAKGSTLLEPRLSLRKKDESPLPKNRFVKAVIPLYYQGHAYRAGSRIRVIISAPNGDQPVWSFGETRPKKTAKVAVAFSKKRPSRLILPVVPGVEIPTGLPACPSLRAQPCRDYPG
jgi:predicted acyl esterase